MCNFSFQCKHIIIIIIIIILSHFRQNFLKLTIYKLTKNVYLCIICYGFAAAVPRNPLQSFLRAWSQLNVFASSFDWFTTLSM